MKANWVSWKLRSQCVFSFTRVNMLQGPGMLVECNINPWRVCR